MPDSIYTHLSVLRNSGFSYLLISQRMWPLLPLSLCHFIRHLSPAWPAHMFGCSAGCRSDMPRFVNFIQGLVSAALWPANFCHILQHQLQHKYRRYFAHHLPDSHIRISFNWFLTQMGGRGMQVLFFSSLKPQQWCLIRCRERILCPSTSCCLQHNHPSLSCT